MNRHHHHFLEKLQVQLAAVAALVVMYLAVGPVLGWWDPQWPTIFVPSASFAQLAGFAGIIWALAAVCALVTVSSRPEGALLAALLGAAGVSLHSAPMLAALWRYDEGQGVLFALLIGEVVLLAVVLSVAELVVHIVRSGVAHCRPGWMWPGRVPPAGWLAGGGVGSDVPRLASAGFRAILVQAWSALKAGGDNESASRRGRVNGRMLVESLSCLGLAVLIASVALMLLMKSEDRGQVLFALFASFLLGVMVAHQKFPTPFGVAAWASPMATAVLFYLLAIVTAVDYDVNAWMHVHFYARALPVDWLTAGGGGAVLGFWISERIHEFRHLEIHKSAEE